MKGLHIQFQSIVSFLEGSITNNIVNQTEDCFLLNIEKMTFETFKLVNIIFTELEDSIPKDIHSGFNKTVSKLKEYFKMKPKTKTQEDEDYKVQYDEVSHYLDNRPEIVVNNDQARGQLYKYLSLAEQKESNTKTLLEAIPRYSNANLQLQLNKFNNSNSQSSFANNSDCNAPMSKVNPNFLPSVNGCHSTSTYANKLKKTQYSTTDQCSTADQQTQTEFSMDSLKLIISDFTKKNLKTYEQTCDFATQMSGFLDNIVEDMKTVKQMAVQINMGQFQKEEKGQIKKEKKEKVIVSDKEAEKTYNKSKKDKKQNKKDIKQVKSIIQLKEQKNDKNISLVNRENESQQLMQKQDKSVEKERIMMESETKQRNNEKGVNRLSQFKKFKGDNSKVEKYDKLKRQYHQQNGDTQNINLNDQKMSEKKTVSKEKMPINKINENKENKDNSDAEKQIYSQLIKQSQIEEGLSRLEGLNKLSVNKKQALLKFNKIDETIKQALQKQEGLCKQQCLQNKQQASMSKKKSNNNTNSREKIMSNKDQTRIEANKTAEQAYITYNQKKFRSLNPKEDEDEDKNALPKIQQKILKVNRAQKSDSIKRKYENSPYAKLLVQNQDQKLSRSNLANQFNNRSLHISPSQPLFLQKDLNRSLYRDDMKQYYPSGGKQKNCLPNIQMQKIQGEGQDTNEMTAEERQIWFKQQNDRLMNEIEENTGTKRNKDLQFLKVIKNIREYEAIHIRFCGQNCIHLQKFYQFLKRKNLSIYANRKQFYLHKKNIEIAYLIH